MGKKKKENLEPFIHFKDTNKFSQTDLYAFNARKKIESLNFTDLQFTTSCLFTFSQDKKIKTLIFRHQ